MGRVRVAGFTVSLDGFDAGPDEAVTVAELTGIEVGPSRASRLTTATPDQRRGAWAVSAFPADPGDLSETDRQATRANDLGSDFIGVRQAEPGPRSRSTVMLTDQPDASLLTVAS